VAAANLKIEANEPAIHENIEFHNLLALLDQHLHEVGSRLKRLAR